MNILFLNAGRRCELVDAFKKVIGRFSGGGLIFGTDINPLAPALAKVDRSIIFPHSSSKDFLKILVQTCRENDIKLVIPTIDPDLKVLSKNLPALKKKLPNTLILVPEYSVVEIAEDKRKTRDFFASCGVEVPRSLKDVKNLEFPVFVKPACGSAGKGARKVNDEAELARLKAKDPSLMIEELIEGPEYTVDVFCDRQKKAKLAIPRKRLAVRGGEVSRGVVERNRELEEVAANIAEKLSCDVPVTIQFRKSAKGFVAMEINARVGGGLPLTIAAGGDWPLWILQMAKGIEPQVGDKVRDGVLLSRYDQSLFIEKTDNSRKKVNLSGIKLIVFDMDDTLYPEREFVFSAYRAVSEYVYEKFGIFIEDDLRRRFSSGQRGDLFSIVLKDLGVKFTEEDIQGLVKRYREHRPSIQPYTDAVVIQELKKAGYKIGLLTDGWKRVQKNKWKALKLEQHFDFTVFTDDFGFEFWKPHEKPFRYICEQAGVKLSEAVYVGDNPSKDFLAPNQLGMKSLRIRRSGGESSENNSFSEDFEASGEIKDLVELRDLLIKKPIKIFSDYSDVVNLF